MYNVSIIFFYQSYSSIKKIAHRSHSSNNTESNNMKCFKLKIITYLLIFFINNEIDKNDKIY